MTFCLSITLFTAALAIAQEFPKPGTEHERLKTFEGTWDAVMDMGGQKTKATAVYKLICDGMWLQSDFRGDVGGAPFQGHGIDGYNLVSKKYVGVWVDSMSSAPMQMEGNYDEKTKLMVMTGESQGPDGKPQKFKTTTENKDKDHFTFKMYMVGDGNADEPIFTIEYTRKK
jgi:hypothetical protein